MSENSSNTPRIALIHALEESIAPIRLAFSRYWPQAVCMDVLDASLSADLAAAGKLDASMIERFVSLGRYAASAEGAGGKATAILFTCSAFGPAIDRVKSDLSIPVLRPNEAAFARALDIGEKIALVASFPPSLPSLTEELKTMAEARGRKVSITPILAEGALAALKSGDGDRHDRAVVNAFDDLADQDVVVLGQFSLARSAESLRHCLSAPVITTPDSAVQELRRVLSDAVEGDTE